MIKKLAASFAALVAALALAAPASADPIREQAAINGCDENNICLYDWINNNYASGFWQRSLPQFTNASDGGVDNCIDLNDQRWHDLQGGYVSNAASSLIINMDGTFLGARAWYFNEGSCSAPGAYRIYRTVPGSTTIETNLAAASTDGTCVNFRCSWNFYDRISSIRYEAS